MAFELNPVAVTAAPLLRAIQSGGWTTMADLANLAGRHPNHMSRDLGALDRAGLVTRDPLALTFEAIDQLAALDRAENPAAPAGGELLPGEMLLTHGQMKPNPDNPRSDFESDEAVEKINELRASILARGLKQNLIVKPDPDDDGLWIVTDGNRRWHGVQQAIWDGDWPEDRPIRVVRDAPGDLEALLTAVVANMQREAMHPLDEARAFATLRDQFMMSTADISRETGKQPRVIQLRLKLLALSDDDMDRMRLPSDHPDHLTYKAATLQLATPRQRISEEELLNQTYDRLAVEFGVTHRSQSLDYHIARSTYAADPVQAAVQSVAEKHSLASLDQIRADVERWRARDILTPKRILCLVEVAHAIASRPSNLFTEEELGHVQTDASRDYIYDQTLIGKPMGQVFEVLSKDERYAVRISLFGQQILTALDLDPTVHGNALFRARCAADIDAAAQRPLRDAGQYVTKWLNVEAASEPDSPPPTSPVPEKSFGERLTDREALMLVEIADKIAREPASAEGLDDYTRVQNAPPDATSNALLARSIIGYRSLGPARFIRILSASSGAGDWLKLLNFADYPKDVLFEMRARVVGADQAAALEEKDAYATPWLNPENDQVSGLSPEGRTLPQIKSEAAPAAEAESGSTSFAEPEQPELIEATEEEKAARVAAEEERRLEASARQSVAFFGSQVGDWMAFARFRGASDFNRDIASLSPEDLCCAVIRALALGDITEAGAALATLYGKGKLASRTTFAEMPAETIAWVIADARAAAPEAAA